MVCREWVWCGNPWKLHLFQQKLCVWERFAFTTFPFWQLCLQFSCSVHLSLRAALCRRNCTWWLLIAPRRRRRRRRTYSCSCTCQGNCCCCCCFAWDDKWKWERYWRMLSEVPTRITSAKWISFWVENWNLDLRGISKRFCLKLVMNKKSFLGWFCPSVIQVFNFFRRVFCTWEIQNWGWGRKSKRQQR